MIHRIWASIRHRFGHTLTTDTPDTCRTRMRWLAWLAGIAFPLDWAYRLWITCLQHEESHHAHLVIYTGAVLASWAAVWLMQRGYTKGSALLLAAAMVSLASITALTHGLSAMHDNHPSLMLGQAYVGMALGRRASWASCAAWMVTLAAGLFTEAMRLSHMGLPWTPAFAHAPSAALGSLVATIVINYCTTLTQPSGGAAHAPMEVAPSPEKSLQELHVRKMETLGRMTSGVAHDFQNVISVILGFTGRRERFADTGSAALLDALASVEVAARRGLTISRKLLAFGRHEVTLHETFDAIHALRELEPMLRQMLGARIRIHGPHASVRRAYICMDRSQFELAVLNIAANTRDAVAGQGDFGMAIETDTQARLAVIELSDNGPGMSEEVRTRIFEPFYTTKSPHAGTGLGLSAVHEWITRAGGSVEASSCIGQGTVVIIRLPLRSATP